MDAPPIQYVATRDGVNIAYCVSGEGPPLVLMPEPFNHLTMMWENPLYRSLFEPLASKFKLIQFDGRGFGLSGRNLTADHTLSKHYLDLEAVLDRLALDQFILYGPYFFGSQAAAYAADHPERVNALILWNIDVPDERPAAFEVLVKDMLFKSFDLFVMTMARTFYAYEDFDSAVARMSVSANPEALVPRDHPGFDIRTILRRVAMPTLVVGNDTAMGGISSRAQTVASLVPGARLVFMTDPAGGRYTSDGNTPPLVRAIDEFLAAIPTGRPPASPANTAVLSERELEVLRLLASGRSNSQIAEELVISPYTVNRHVSNIYTKTGAANRAEAATYASRNGIA